MLDASFYNTSNIFCWGLCQEHYKTTYEDGCCSFQGIVHLTLAILETLPILSQIISTIEYLVFLFFQESEEPPPQLSPTPQSQQTDPPIREPHCRSYRKAIQPKAPPPPSSQVQQLTDSQVRENYRRFYHKEILPAIKTGKYTLEGEDVPLFLEDMRKGTRVYTGAEFANTTHLPQDRFPSARPEVVEEDSFQGALALIQEGHKDVAVLNFANAFTPGGGVEGLFNLAQEESLCRRCGLKVSIDPKLNSHLAKQLKGGKYRIPEEGCIYSPDVPVFARENKDHSFTWFKQNEIYRVAIISSAAIDLRIPEGGYRKVNVEVDNPLMRLKIRMQLNCAIANRQTALVLGAFGCGAFGYPPETVADLYKKELYDPIYPGGPCYAQYFKRIRFSILVTNNRDKNNLETFQRVFNPA